MLVRKQHGKLTPQRKDNYKNGPLPGGSRIRGTDNLKDHTIKLTELLTVLNSENPVRTLKTDTFDESIKQNKDSCHSHCVMHTQCE